MGSQGRNLESGIKAEDADGLAPRLTSSYLSSFSFNICFISFYVCECFAGMYAVPKNARRERQIGNGVIDGSELPCGCGEQNLTPLEQS